MVDQCDEDDDGHGHPDRGEHSHHLPVSTSVAITKTFQSSFGATRGQRIVKVLVLGLLVFIMFVFINLIFYLVGTQIQSANSMAEKIKICKCAQCFFNRYVL